MSEYFHGLAMLTRLLHLWLLLVEPPSAGENCEVERD